MKLPSLRNLRSQCASEEGVGASKAHKAWASAASNQHNNGKITHTSLSRKNAPHVFILGVGVDFDCCDLRAPLARMPTGEGGRPMPWDRDGFSRRGSSSQRRTRQLPCSTRLRVGAGVRFNDALGNSCAPHAYVVNPAARPVEAALLIAQG